MDLCDRSPDAICHFFNFFFLVAEDRRGKGKKSGRGLRGGADGGAGNSDSGAGGGDDGDGGAGDGDDGADGRDRGAGGGDGGAGDGDGSAGGSDGGASGGSIGGSDEELYSDRFGIPRGGDMTSMDLRFAHERLFLVFVSSS